MDLMAENTEAKVLEDVLVEISEDKMKAYIRFVRSDDGVSEVTFEYIVGKLRDSNVNFGISDNLIQDALHKKEIHAKYLIAVGKQARKGTDAKLDYHVEIDRQIEPKLLEDGKVDFHNLDLITNVTAGKELVTLIPEVPGEEGKDVCGKNLKPPKPKKLILPKGKNVKIDEATHTLIAEIDGQVVKELGKISVKQVFEVNGDVDHSTGNIEFLGNVIIRGNVKTGFKIRAKGNVEVMGVVEGAIIEAEGDIVLDKGMQGMKKGILEAKGDIVAKFVENATLRAEGNIKAGTLMHSNVVANESIEVFGKKALLVGGTAEARKKITAKTIGSSFATQTELKVGVDHKLLNTFNELNKEMSLYRKEVQKIDAAITSFKAVAQKNGLTDDKKAILMKLIEQRQGYAVKVADIDQQAEKIREALNEKIDARIGAEIKIYPGVQVTIGKCFMHVYEELVRSTLYREGADIKVGPYY